MDEISAIDLFFKSHHILFSRPWLESCINWCKEEDLPPNYSEKDLRLKVFEQWLLCDLRDVEIPSLPPNLSSKVNYTLTGSFSLQLMKVIDISKPKFWQIQRIRNGVAKNLDQEVESSKRVLMLTLTDGVQEIEATELRPIPCLNLNISPGIKITLTGPIEVRWGRLMLEDKHVNVRGGEVESLLVENAAENILAKHLNLPLNPEPNIIQESLLTANTEIFNETGVTTDGINATHNTSTRNPLTNQQPSFGPNTNNHINSNNSRTNNPTATSFNTVENSNNLQNTNTVGLSRDEIDYNELEEQRINEEMDILMEVERDFEEKQVKRRKPNRTPDIFDTMDIDDSDFENIHMPDTMKKPTEAESSIVAAKTVISEKNSEIINLSDSLELENDVFEGLDIEAHLDKIDEQHKISQPLQPKVWPIDRLVNSIPNISNGKFKIKCKFKSIVEKMILVDEEFHLVIEVEDETGDISVKLHSDIVADLIGFSAAELMKLKAEIMENNFAAQSKILEGLKGLKEKLIELDKIAEVQVNVREKYPVVLKFF